MGTISFPLRVVFYYECDRWIAHCLEFDLIGDGSTQDESLECLREAIDLQVRASVEHGNADNLFSPADGQIFRMFAQGKHIGTGKLSIQVDNVNLQEVETREYSEGADTREVCIS